MENISDRQRQLLDCLREEMPDLTYRWNEERGVASLMEGNLLPWRQDPGRAQKAEAGRQEDMVEGLAMAFLDKYGILVGPEDVKSGISGLSYKRDWKKGGFQIRMGQVFPFPGKEALPVFDAVLLIFVDRERNVYRAQSSFWRDVRLSGVQTISRENLSAHLLERLNHDPDKTEAELYPRGSMPIPCLYPVRGEFHPAFYTQAYQAVRRQQPGGVCAKRLSRVHCILDAATGKIIRKRPVRFGLSSEPRPHAQSEGMDPAISKGSEKNLIKIYDAAGRKEYERLVEKLSSENNLCRMEEGSADGSTRRGRDAPEGPRTPEFEARNQAKSALAFYRNLGWDGFEHVDQIKVAVNTGMGLDCTGFDSYTDPETGRFYTFIYYGDGMDDEGGERIFDCMAGDPTIFSHEYQHAVTLFGIGGSDENGFLLKTRWVYAITEGLSDAFACLKCKAWIFPLFQPGGALHRGPAFMYAFEDGKKRQAHRQPFRRIEYPRSTDTFWGDWYCDHFSDRKADNQVPEVGPDQIDYFRSTLFSHLAFLIGQGGVHQRAFRTATLIPVTSIGCRGAAQIFLYFVTALFEGMPLLTDLRPGERVLIEAAWNLLDAAEHCEGKKSSAYVMMRRALYALGLYPHDEKHVPKPYGGEACMLPWTWDWRFSGPYIGFPDLPWKSPDLIVSSDGDGRTASNPRFEKETHLFARVRNIGDADLQNVLVRFYFHPLCTNLPVENEGGWKACRTKTGQDCILKIENLPAGSMAFEDLGEASPGQSVRWHLTPKDQVGRVKHFSLRAVIDFDGQKPPNHENDYSYQVQSSVIILDPAEGAEQTFHFQASCPLSDVNQAEAGSNDPPNSRLEVKSTLPAGYRIETEPARENNEIILKPGETIVTCRVMMPENRTDRLEPPFEGRVASSFKATLKERRITGEFIGELCVEPYSDTISSATPMESGGGLNVTLADTETQQSAGNKKVKLTRMLSGKINAVIDGKKVSGSTHGSFTGALDPGTGELLGEYKCNVMFATGMFADEYRRNRVTMDLRGTLQPLRAIHFTQYIGDDAVGGVTVIAKEPAMEAAVGR